MAGIALIAGIDMGRRFARRICTVVTAYAGTHSLVVIHRGYRRPGSGGMTRCADITGKNMRW